MSAWPAGDGEMAGRIRAFDWAGTPLGPLAAWPPTLRFAVDLTLGSPGAAILLWGPALTQIYNDPWRRMMHRKHPAALGQPTHACFPEIAGTLAPVYARVLGGEPVVLDDMLLPLFRDGEIRDAWWTVHYVPLREGGGAVAGAFCTVVETTGRILARRERAAVDAALRESEGRQAVLLGLSDALRDLREPAAILGTAQRILGEHLKATRVTYAEDEGDGEHVRFGACWTDGAPCMGGRHRYADYGSGLLARLRSGETYPREDIAADPALTAEQKASYARIGVGAALSVPLVKGGRLVAVLSVQHAGPHRFTPAEIGIAEGAAERSWAALERGRAEVALRDSEARLRIERGLLDAVIRQAPVGIAITEALEGRAIAFNDRLKAMLGRDEMGSDARRFGRYGAVDHEGAPYGLDDYPTLRVLRRGETVEREEMLYRRPGAGEAAEPTRFEVSSAPVRDDAGEVVAAVTVVVDVEAQRRAEAALQESEAMLRLALAGSRMADWRWDTRDDTVRADPRLAEMWGLEIGDGPFPLSAFTDRMAPEGREELGRVVARARAFGEEIDGCVDIVAGPSAGKAVRWRGRARQGEPWILEGISFDVTEQRRAELALRDSEARLRTLAEGIPQLVWRAVGEGRRTWASPQWTAYTGQPEPESRGLGWLAPVHPDDRDAVLAAWADAVKRGEFRADYRLRHAAEGRYRWFQVRATPLRDGHGDIREWLGTSTDVDDLRRLRERQDVLVAELQHRTRNLLAVVQGIASDTMEHTGPTEAFRDALADRLSALSRVQGLLSRSESQPITIAALVGLELDALGSGAPDARITVDGPEAFLRSSTVQTLALALHELATNARKYGALSQARGRLAVSWRESQDGGEHRLALDWVETGCEPAPGPARADGSGYGRELIERALPHALGARTTYALTGTGVRCTIDLPARPGPGDGRA